MGPSRTGRALGIAVAVLVAPVSPGAAQEAPVRLEDGATWVLTSWHSQAWTPPEGMTPPFTAVVAKRVTWRSGKDGATLVLAPMPAPANSVPFGVEVSQTLDVPFAVRVDGALAPLGFADPDAVRAATEQLVLRGLPAEQLDSVKKRFPRVMDATAQALTLRELRLASAGQGHELVPGRSVSLKGESPNPMGGAPIPGRKTVTVESKDARSGRAIVVMRQTSDLSKMQEELKKLGDLEASALPGRGPAAPKVKASCRYVVDLKTRLALEVECVNEVSILASDGPHRLEERWKITQTVPAAP